MRGKKWTADHTAIVKEMYWFAYDHEIAEATGHCVDTVQRRRSMLGLSAYRGPRVRYGIWGDLTADARRAISMVASAA